ncbi:CHAD domain-containing protein [Nitrosophilus kaiyonis]|uniref:CYTH and CHAD domain-containing protein n=1 Tax=Nitrosophilus kaiyonis TaxID=2930200 RepID=UPI00248FC9DD|nr:CHAD domain-containing protein [Nitrosophilus kaiyonis]
MSLEIEKKFLLKPFNIKNFLKKYKIPYKKIKIKQIYLAKNPPIRIRKYGKKYILTTKKGSGLIRKEYEKNINKKEFLQYLKNYKKIGELKKIRYIFKIKNFTYELDIFKKDLKGLFFLEVEFKNKKSANKFRIDKRFKDFLIEDVTENREFSNFSLAKNKKIPSKNCNNILEVELIDPLCSTKDSLKTLFHSFNRNIIYYQKKFLEDNDPEHIHKIRVNLRKTRVFLKEYKKYLNEEENKNFSSFFKNFMQKSNKKRDIDVLKENFFKYKISIPKDLKKYLENLLLEETNKIKNLLKSDEFEKLKEIYSNMQKESFYNQNSNVPIIISSYNIIEKKISKIFDITKKLNQNSPADEFHKLRIEFKKFRYLLEAFSHFYNIKEIENLIKKTKNIQDILGSLQDIETGIKLLNEIANTAFQNENKIIEDITIRLEDEKIINKKLFFKKYKNLKKYLKNSIIF